MIYEELVNDFHKTYSIPVEQSPVIPSKERCLLRIALIQEELNELKEALESGDIEHAAKEAADLQYVVSGTVLEMGLKNIFKAAFFEVHRSNMSKVCATIKDARELAGENGRVEYVDNGFIAYNAAGKVLKPPTYSKADLSFIKW